MNFSGASTSLSYKNQDEGNLWPCAIATSAPLSVNSTWSEAPSLFSDNSSISSDPSILSSPPFPTHKINSFPDNYPPTTAKWSNTSIRMPVESQKYQDSERGAITTRTGYSPKLIRHSTLTDSLVDSSTRMVEAIWPLSAVRYKNGPGSKEIIPLREFIRETIHRSGTSYSTLQVTLYYLILIKSHVLKQENVMGRNLRQNPRCALLCGRRMFISALILASKYLQDRNFTAHAWSKISGLDVLEINQNEITFLLAVNWQLHITLPIFKRWTQIFTNYFLFPYPSMPKMAIAHDELSSKWRNMILALNPRLDNFHPLTTSPLTHSIDSPYSPHFVSGMAGYKSISLDTPEPPVITFQSNLTEPFITACPSNRRVSALGLPATLRTISQDYPLPSPSYVVSTGFETTRAGGLLTQPPFKLQPISYNNSAISRSTYGFESYATSQDTLYFTPNFNVSSKQMNLSPSQSKISSIKLSTPLTSFPLSPTKTPNLLFRQGQDFSKGRKIDLNKIKIKNNKINIFKLSNSCSEKDRNEFMNICSDAHLRQNISHKNVFTNNREFTQSLWLPSQYSLSVNSHFTANSHLDLNSNISENRCQLRNLFDMPNIPLLSKKRSSTESDYLSSVLGMNNVIDGNSGFEISAPRKRVCCAFEASRMYNDDNLPIGNTLTRPSFFGLNLK